VCFLGVVVGVGFGCFCCLISYLCGCVVFVFSFLGFFFFLGFFCFVFGVLVGCVFLVGVVVGKFFLSSFRPAPWALRIYPGYQPIHIFQPGFAIQGTSSREHDFLLFIAAISVLPYSWLGDFSLLFYLPGLGHSRTVVFSRNQSALAKTFSLGGNPDGLLFPIRESSTASLLLFFP